LDDRKLTIRVDMRRSGKLEDARRRMADLMVSDPQMLNVVKAEIRRAAPLAVLAKANPLLADAIERARDHELRRLKSRVMHGGDSAEVPELRDFGRAMRVLARSLARSRLVDALRREGLWPSR